MTVGTKFTAASSHEIVLASNDFTSMTTTFSVWGMVYLVDNPSSRYIIAAMNAGTPCIAVRMDSGNLVIDSGADSPPWFTAVTNGAWHFFCITKAAGTVAPKAYLTTDGSTWSLDGAAAGAGTLSNADLGSGVINDFRIGSVLASNYFNGNIAALGISNTELNAATAKGLINYANWASVSGIQFNTAESMISGGTVNDTSAINNDETSRVGTATGDQTIPSWFTNFGANLGTLGRPTRTVEFVKAVGTVTNTTSGTTSAITVAAGGVPVGNSVVILASHDNSNTSPAGGIQVTSVSDTRGNTWNTTTHAIADPIGANVGQEGWIAWSHITTALQASDTITITYAVTVPAKAIRADEFRNLGGLLEQQVQNDQTSTTTSVTVTPTGVGQLVIGGVFVEGGTADSFTQDADTTNGSWVNPGRLGSGTTTSGATLNPIYKIVTAAGAQTYNPTMGTARDHCAGLAVFNVRPYDTRPDSFGRHRGRARVRRR